MFYVNMSYIPTQIIPRYYILRRRSDIFIRTYIALLLNLLNYIIREWYIKEISKPRYNSFLPSQIINYSRNIFTDISKDLCGHRTSNCHTYNQVPSYNTPCLCNSFYLVVLSFLDGGGWVGDYRIVTFLFYFFH